MQHDIIYRLKWIMNQPMQEEAWILKQLKQIIEEKSVGEVQTIEAKQLSDCLKDFQSSPVLTYRSGITELDKLIGGFMESEFIVVGARPGMGKTHFLINMALSVSINRPTLYYSLDLSERQLTDRMVSSLTKIPLDSLLNNKLSDEQQKSMEALKKNTAKNHLYLYSNHASSVHLFLDVCKKFIRENGVRIIFLDYLQLLTSQQYRHNREHEMSYVSRLLKAFVREENVCLFASCQLSRAVEQRYGDHKPILSDLRDSGAFEQDADKVFFLYRPEYYGILKDDGGQNNACLIELILAKNRNGNTGTVFLSRDESFTSLVPFKRKEDVFTISHTRLDELKTVF